MESFSLGRTAKKLHASGYNVLLLGGPDEDLRNKEIQNLSGGNSAVSRILSVKNIYLAR